MDGIMLGGFWVRGPLTLFAQDSPRLQLWSQHNCCRKGDPFQGPNLGSCLPLGNELSEETHMLTKQEILLG